MSLSNLQLETNRANAQHSTGPRTPEGKQRSSLNATRHGLTGQVVVLPDEDFERYNTHCREFFEEWRPVGPTEKHLVQTLADAQWRLHRAHARERAIFAMGHLELGDKINTERPEVHALFTSALVETRQSCELDRLSRYASRIQRDYHKLLHELQSLQAQRKARTQAGREQAVMLNNYFEMKKETWNPAQFGFVLTVSEIQEQTQLAKHIEEAQRAKSHRYNLKNYTVTAPA